MATVYVDRYEVQGTGSSSDENVCLDRNLDRRVTIAWRWPKSAEDAVRIRFARLLQVQSPNVVDIYDLVPNGPRLGVVHELCAGAPLSVDKPASAIELLKVLYQLARAIADISTVGVAVGPLDPDLFCYAESGLLKLAHLTPTMLSDTPASVADNLKHLGKMATSIIEMFADVPEDVVTIFKAMALDAAAAPSTASDVVAKISAYLVKDMHRAVLTYHGRAVELNTARRRVSLSHPAGIARVDIAYDGLTFQISATSGEVYVNNQAAAADAVIPEACIIALGGPQRPANQRQFVTMDLSHPGVVL